MQKSYRTGRGRGHKKCLDDLKDLHFVSSAVCTYKGRRERERRKRARERNNLSLTNQFNRERQKFKASRICKAFSYQMMTSEMTAENCFLLSRGF
jgi:hypothetical protein